jgi:hypothetical protein
MIRLIAIHKYYSLLPILLLLLLLVLVLVVLMIATTQRRSPSYHPPSTKILGVVQGWTPTIIGGNSRRTTTIMRRTTTTTPRTRTRKMMSGSSYEDQYAEFLNNEKRKPQEQQPSLLSSPLPDDDTTLLTSNSNSNSNSNSKISREDREIAFLQFISSSTPYQSNAVPPVISQQQQQQQQQQYPQLYDNISTSLEFSAFNNNKNSAINDGDNNNQRDNVATTGGSSFSFASSYLDSLSGNNNINNEEIIAVEEANTIRPDTDTAVTTSATITTPNNNERNNEEVHDIIDAYNDAAAVAAMLGSADSTTTSIDDSQSASASTIEVQVKTTFPSGITVERAKYGWLDFCWMKGAGIIITADKNDDNIRYSTTSRKSERGDDNYIDNDDGSGRVPRVRKLMIPFGMKQEIVSMTSSSTKTTPPSSSLDVTTTIEENDGDGDDDKVVILRRDKISYRTTQRGMFCQDFLKDSHGGTVEFIETLLLPNSDSSSSLSSSSVDDLAVTQQTQMIWTVQFQVVEQELRDNNSYNNTQQNTRTLKENFWAYWSQFQLKTASQNLLAYLDTSTNPIFIEHIESMPIGISPREAMEKWHDYYWCRGGGGFPTLFVPPVLLQNNKKRWIVPSGLEEEMISVGYSNDSNNTDNNKEEMAEAIYKVNNPNLLTYPVHYHRAKVRFARENINKPTQLIWNIEVQPYRKSLGIGVQFWTKSSIISASRNLRRYLEEELQPQQNQKQPKQQKPVGAYSKEHLDQQLTNATTAIDEPSINS